MERKENPNRVRTERERGDKKSRAIKKRKNRARVEQEENSTEGPERTEGARVVREGSQADVENKVRRWREAGIKSAGAERDGGRGTGLTGAVMDVENQYGRTFRSGRCR